MSITQKVLKTLATPEKKAAGEKALQDAEQFMTGSEDNTKSIA